MKKSLILGASSAILAGIMFMSSGEHTNSVDAATKDITSLQKANWVTDSGMTRAVNHDRQDLGVVLRKGATLKIRKQSTNDSYNNLTLWLLNTDHNTEKKINLTNDWQTVTVDTTSVPFIGTPYGDSHSEVEYDIEGPNVPLPIYKKGDNQENFLRNWDKSNAEFGLVQGDKFQVMVGSYEKDKLNKLNDFSNLDDYIDYQNDVINFYDHLMGLSENDSNQYNQIPKNRFFLKADTSSGTGVMAYYTTDYAANATSSIVDSWMIKGNWKTLHEIGHAYQPSYNKISSNLMYTGEVTNNLLGNAYLLTHYGKQKVESDWLYNNGNKEKIENNLYDKLFSKKMTYNQLGSSRDQLVVLTNLIQSADLNVWTQFNTWYREAVNNKDSSVQNTTLPNLLNQFYSDKTGKNYTPVFEQFGLQLSDTNQSDINKENYSNLTTLASVVPERMLQKAATTIPGQMTDSIFNVVSNEQLKALGLKGSLAINLNSDRFNELKGKSLVLKDGNKIIASAKIENNIVKFDNIDNGAYSVELDNKPTDLQLSQNYVYVKDDENSATIDFTDKDYADFQNAPIIIQGYGDSEVANLKPKFNKSEITFNTISKKAHYRFDNQKYAEVKVYDNNNKVIFDKVINGTNGSTESINVPMKENYKIEIYHAEAATRLKFPEVSNLIDTKNKTNTFVVKNGYLENAATHVDSLSTLVDNAITELKQNSKLNQVNNSTLKNDILLAVNYLNPQQKSELLQSNKQLLTINPIKLPKEYDSEISLLDNSNIQFAALKMNIKNGDLGVDILDTTNQKLNSYVEIKDETGKVVYSNLVANNSEKGLTELSLKEGYSIKVTQPDNYTVKSKDLGEFSGSQSFVVNNGQLISENLKSNLDSVNNDGQLLAKLQGDNKLQAQKELVRKIALLPTEYQSQLLQKFNLNQTNIQNDQIVINGRTTKQQVATVDINHDNNELTVNINANRPRTKTIITIKDENNNIVFNQTINNSDNLNSVKTIKVKDNYTVNISSDSKNTVKSTFANLVNKDANQFSSKVSNGYLIK